MKHTSRIDNSILVALFLNGFADLITRLCKNYVCILSTFDDTNITFSSDFIMSSRSESATIPSSTPRKNHRLVSEFVTSRKKRPPFVSQPKIKDTIKIPYRYFCDLSDSACCNKLHVCCNPIAHHVIFATLIPNDTTNQIIFNPYLWSM